MFVYQTWIGEDIVNDIYQTYYSNYSFDKLKIILHNRHFHVGSLILGWNYDDTVLTYIVTSSIYGGKESYSLVISTSSVSITAIKNVSYTEVMKYLMIFEDILKHKYANNHKIAIIDIDNLRYLLNQPVFAELPKECSNGC